MSIYLVSYRPLAFLPEGEKAITEHKLPPFVDYSCRKEPDFMSAYPSITALCRKGKFAPRLREGDLVVYITLKGSYLGVEQKHWRLTAILEVLMRFSSHEDAAQWYQTQGIRLPNNCMVEGNPPSPLEMAAPNTPFKRDLRKWDLEYQRRAREYGDFLACKPHFLELYEPPLVTERMMYAVFKRIPGTRNPGRISHEEFEQLRQECRIE